MFSSSFRRQPDSPCGEEPMLMTGGQMAPTSLIGQITQTSPYGRDADTQGYPIRVCELLSELDGPAYLERVTVNNVKNVNSARRAIKKAFQNQVEGKGFSLIEVVSSCPTNWGMFPGPHQVGLSSGPRTWYDRGDIL